MKAETVLARFRNRGAPGRRSSARAGHTDSPLRGDHDLNPELYDPGQSLRRAAVLVPLVEQGGELTLLLTKRSPSLADHAGQISFPGGRIESSDKSVAAAALREAQEEVGLDPESVRLIGELDTYLVRTGYQVFPQVGLVQGPLQLVPDESEVEEAFEVPLGFFLRPGAKQRHSRMFRGKERHFFAYPYGDYYIWGATAGMIGNLVEILKPDLEA